MADRKLIVEIVGDDTSLQRSLNRSSQALQQFDKKTTRTTGPGSVGRQDGPLGQLLGDVQKQKARADDLMSKEEELARRHEAVGERLSRAALIGGGFFALGRSVEGAGAALAAFEGHASETSNALNDAGSAIQSIVTLNPEGFFQAVGASGKRAAENFKEYAAQLTDVNNLEHASVMEQAARIGGHIEEADAIRKKVAVLKAEATALDAVAFAQRDFNTAVVEGQNVQVTFRGASAAEDVRGGLRGAGGVGIQRASSGDFTVDTTVNIDGESVGRSQKKVTQKDKRRNPRQKRGPNSAFR